MTLVNAPLLALRGLPVGILKFALLASPNAPVARSNSRRRALFSSASLADFRLSSSSLASVIREESLGRVRSNVDAVRPQQPQKFRAVRTFVPRHRQPNLLRFLQLLELFRG